MNSVTSVEVFGRDGSGPFPIEEKVVKSMTQAILIEHICNGNVLDIVECGSEKPHPDAKPLFTFVGKGVKQITYAVPLN